MRLIDADKLLKDMKSYCTKNCMKCNKSTFLAVDEHCGMIDEQPTVNEWIPFDPDNPPETGKYIITYIIGGCIFSDCDVFFKGSMQWAMFGDDVIAYMPAPKPYEPMIEEKEKDDKTD